MEWDLGVALYAAGVAIVSLLILAADRVRGWPLLGLGLLSFAVSALVFVLAATRYSIMMELLK